MIADIAYNENIYKEDMLIFETELLHLQSQFIFETNSLATISKTPNGYSSKDYEDAEYRELTPEEKEKEQEKNKKKKNIFIKIKDTIKKMIGKFITFIKTKLKTYFLKIKEWIIKFKESSKIKKALRDWSKDKSKKVQVSDKPYTLLFPKKEELKFHILTYIDKDFFPKMNNFLMCFEDAEQNLNKIKDIALYCAGYQKYGFDYIDEKLREFKFAMKKESKEEIVNAHRKYYRENYTKAIKLDDGKISFEDFNYIYDCLDKLQENIQMVIDAQDKEEKNMNKFIKETEKMDLGVIRESIFKLFKVFTNMVVECEGIRIAILDANRRELFEALQHTNVITNFVVKSFA